MTRSRDKLALWCFILILSVQTVLMIYVGTLKQGYFIDEIFTYTDSNSFYQPRARDFIVENSWLELDLAEKMLTVDPEYRFRFDSAYDSQIDNAHPPLYYFLINAVSSLFPGKFSKWFGISINLFSFVLTTIFVYLISLKIFQNRWTALFPMLFFGFSIAAATMVNYIRMYYLVTAFGLVFLYIQLCILENSGSKKYLLLNVLVIFLGAFTHYYFLIFAFFMCALIVLRSLCRKEYAAASMYSMSSILGVVLSVAAFPSAINHLFFRPRGVEAVSKLTSLDGWFQEIRKMTKFITNGLFASNFRWILLFIFISLSLGALYYLRISSNRGNMRSKLKEASGDIHLQFIFFLSVTVVLFTVIISHIVPFLTDRYIMNLYPIIPIICFYITNKLKVTKKMIPVCSIIVLVACLVLNMNAIAHKEMKYLYRGELERRRIVEEYHGYPCVFVMTKLDTIQELMLEMENYEGVYYMTNVDDLRRVDEILKERTEDEKGFVLYVERSVDREKAIEDVMSTGTYANSEYLFRTPTYYRAYFFEGLGNSAMSAEE